MLPEPDDVMDLLMVLDDAAHAGQDLGTASVAEVPEQEGAAAEPEVESGPDRPELIGHPPRRRTIPMLDPLATPHAGIAVFDGEGGERLDLVPRRPAHPEGVVLHGVALREVTGDDHRLTDQALGRDHPRLWPATEEVEGTPREDLEVAVGFSTAQAPTVVLPPLLALG